MDGVLVDRKQRQEPLAAQRIVSRAGDSVRALDGLGLRPQERRRRDLYSVREKGRPKSELNKLSSHISSRNAWEAPVPSAWLYTRDG